MRQLLFIVVNWGEIYYYLRRYVLNKYVLVCVLFSFVLAFCGNESWVNQSRQRRQIAELERELDNYRVQTEHYRVAIEELEGNRESLERYAREHYYMHTEDEDVYLVDE